MLSNRASKWAVDAYGGWGIFLEFREWYHNDRQKVGADRTAPEGHNGEVRGASVTAQPACEASSREAATSTVVLCAAARKETM